MPRHVFFLLITCLFMLEARSAYALTQYTYDVEIPQDLKSFEVKLCFASAPPKYLFLGDEDAHSDFRNIYRLRQNQQYPLTPSQQYLDLTNAKQGDCIRYTAVFNNNITHPWFNTRQSTQDQILIELSQWLWQPVQKGEIAISLAFHLPQEYELSAPGKLIRSTPGLRVYQLRPHSLDSEGRIAVGRFTKLLRQEHGSRVEIALLNANKQFDQKLFLNWVDNNLDAMRQINGQSPVTDLQILVIPVGTDREAVPWGQTARGGGEAVHVYIDQTRPIAEFMTDWVLIHELAHLVHPPISGNGNWLSEGLASYYQNLLRARAGLLSAEQAWENLHAGFERGLRGTPADRTLDQATETMRRDQLFMRVYWSGAAMSLIADTRLRIESNNKMSLDSVLHKFARCCLPADEEWTARELMEKYDELADTTIFTELYNQYVNSTQFPDLNATYAALGLKKQGAQLEFVTTPGFSIRREIMQKKN